MCAPGDSGREPWRELPHSGSGSSQRARNGRLLARPEASCQWRTQGPGSKTAAHQRSQHPRDTHPKGRRSEPTPTTPTPKYGGARSTQLRIHIEDAPGQDHRLRARIYSIQPEEGTGVHSSPRHAKVPPRPRSEEHHKAAQFRPKSHQPPARPE